MSKFHHTKEYRTWKKKVTKQGNYRCEVTGVKKDLRTHHLFNVKDYPELKTSVENGILISNKLHTIFHNHYMGGYQRSCTDLDWNEFLKSIEKEIHLFAKNDLL